MIKFENTNVVGWEAAIRGMRNPMNSWEKSDSGYEFIDYSPSEDQDIYGYAIGPNDLDLMQRLRSAGTDHRKFLRMIVVHVDITAPLYWWKEFDTYKIGTVANSCSTMHKIMDKEFTLDDFSYEHLIDEDLEMYNPIIMIQKVINCLNECRDRYIKTKEKPMKSERARQDLLKKYWWQIIQLLPSSYNQKRTVMLNYEVLNNIYKSRKNHKLDEWSIGFMDWIKSLPYAKELIIGEN